MSKPESKLEYVKAFIIEMISSGDDKSSESNLKLLKDWFMSEDYLKDIEQVSHKKTIERKLDAVSKELKKILPWNAILPSEKISNPTIGANSDCNEDNTFHVDEFLYDESDLEKALDEKGIKQKYCADCGSFNIKDTIFISHSLSRLKIRYMFDVLLPKELSKLRILDVGSRIGAVLYGAYFHTNSCEIFGVEINKELCDVQNKMVSTFNMGERVKIINEDILTQQDVVATSDIIILNNVFEFFMDTDTQIKIWNFLKKNVKKGCIMVTIPSLEESLDNLNIYDNFSRWVTKCEPYQEGNSVFFDEDTLLSFHDMYLYEIK